MPITQLNLNGEVWARLIPFLALESLSQPFVCILFLSIWTVFGVDLQKQFLSYIISGNILSGIEYNKIQTQAIFGPKHIKEIWWQHSFRTDNTTIRISCNLVDKQLVNWSEISLVLSWESNFEWRTRVKKVAARKLTRIEFSGLQHEVTFSYLHLGEVKLLIMCLLMIWLEVGVRNWLGCFGYFFMKRSWN